VDAALDAGIRVSPVPGPTALATLLSASGLTADRFVFDGFLPHRGGERRRRLRGLAGETRTVVVHESPHRIRETLEDMREILGDRRIALGRELTKVHETILRGSPEELLRSLAGGQVRGEITLAIEGAAPGSRTTVSSGSEERLRNAWRRELEQASGDRREALRTTARSLGMKRAELYRRLVETGEIRD
jgi:16S rRNA (cytidine1402-2'-O)-methyltransferase